ALRGRVQPHFQQEPRAVRMLAEDRIALLQRRELQAVNDVVDEKDRITRVERILDKRRQQLALPLRVRLPPPRLRHAGRLTEAESWVTLLACRPRTARPSSRHRSRSRPRRSSRQA